ncbi:uncharacterized protein LOC117646045 isoform X2 [Thrips palmi]|uniref:Uncharacterized protein LOC117646045 isoform X2 n=1 Tax=Thrips palmi TaxID=161013 RepID=A0A6P8YY50_THRPL|nr:uncharacterized protein LOC117646045 isoform X2 [Thrips palmi]XP_034242586.1 uncharacterized protein LOC117646045 isoform X2 [Thrips palmi]
MLDLVEFPKSCLPPSGTNTVFCFPGAPAGPTARISVKKAFCINNFGPREPLLKFGTHANLEAVGVQEEDAEEPQFAARPSAQGCIEELDLNDLCRVEPGESLEEKVATLKRLQQLGVRRLNNVWCNADSSWALDVLCCAASTLEEVCIFDPSEEHLLAVQGMPRLRRMRVSSRAPRSSPLSTLVLPKAQGGLKWLSVAGLPRPTLLSLLQALSASLEVLILEAELPSVRSSVPGECHSGPREPVDDLIDLLAQCDLRLSRLVLRRPCGCRPCSAHRRPEDLSLRQL